MVDRRILIPIARRRIYPSLKRTARSSRGPSDLLGTGVGLNIVSRVDYRIGNGTITIPGSVKSIIRGSSRRHSKRPDGTMKRADTDPIKHHTSIERTARRRSDAVSTAILDT